MPISARYPHAEAEGGFCGKFEIGVTDAALATLSAVSRGFDELLNACRTAGALCRRFGLRHQGGHPCLCADQGPKTYEHVQPEKLGNRRLVLVSTQAGRSNVLAELDRLGVAVAKDDPRVSRILDEVKEREALGYSYEGADASFYVLAQRLLGRVPEFFKVERFKVNVDVASMRRAIVTFSEAIVKVRIGETSRISAAEGDGPVNALDKALRKDLGRYQSHIKGLKLTDFKVRIFQGGTDAVTRVLIDSTDETGESWTTVGVSANIIDASFQALTDSVVYKLLRMHMAGTLRRNEKGAEAPSNSQSVKRMVLSTQRSCSVGSNSARHPRRKRRW